MERMQTQQKYGRYDQSLQLFLRGLKYPLSTFQARLSPVVASVMKTGNIPLGILG